MAREAKKLVYQMLKGAQRIDLANVGRDKYFRILADVVVDGKVVSEALIEKGLAVKYGAGQVTVAINQFGVELGADFSSGSDHLVLRLAATY